MVKIRPECFPQGAVMKHHARSAGPSKILKRNNDNSLILELPERFNISSTFNVEDLVEYKGPLFDSSIIFHRKNDPFMECEILHLLNKISQDNATNTISKIVDYNILSI